MSGAGCDIEIVSVEFAGLTAWTIALGAYGPVPARWTSAWAAMLAHGAPQHVPLRSENSCGYHAWLVRYADKCSAI